MEGLFCLDKIDRQAQFFLKKQGIYILADNIENSDKKKDLEKEKRYILCKFCKNRITSADHAIEISGNHQHVCTNPEGDKFNIGCFAKADGCAATEGWTLEFTWFVGFSWRVTVCSSCNVQLGWQYQAMDDRSFYGLVVNRLLYDL